MLIEVTFHCSKAFVPSFIDLTRFADQGVNLTNVTSITLGFGNKSNSVAGGAGSDGVRLQMEYFQKILVKAMLMTGCKSLSQVSSDILLRNLLEDSHATED